MTATRRCLRFLALAATLCCAACAATPAAEWRFLPETRAAESRAMRPPRSLVARRCATPPVIDGNLDDPAWAAAEAQSDFVLLADTARRLMLSVVGSPDLPDPVVLPAARQATVRVAYDDACLYVALDSAEPDPASVRREHQENEVPVLWQDDTFEMILDPDADRGRYFHFMANANDRVTDGEFGPGIQRTDRFRWTSAWRCASKLTNGRWRMELAVPFRDLRVSTPTPGVTWLANFARSKTARFQRQMPNGIPLSVEGEFAVWMMADKQFHETWSLGELVFDRPPAVRIESVDWNDPAWGRNTAEVVLRNQTDRPVQAQAVVAGLTTEPVEVTLAPGQEAKARVPYVIETKGKPVDLKLEVRSGADLLASRQTQAVVAERVFDARPREEMLWDGEDRLAVDFRLLLGRDALPGARIELSSAGQRERIAPTTCRGVGVIPVSPRGDVEVEATLLLDDRPVETHRRVVRRLPRPEAW